jgi:AhpD family alkylhydroperoxidase
MKGEPTIKRQKTFKKRHFKNILQAIKEAARLFKTRSTFRAANHSGKISKQFRARLRLAVTEVNRCRYCSYAHTKIALQSGLTQSEIQGILKHNVQGSPEEEMQAILYAQHWAENDGQPDAEVRKSLVKRYGSGKTETIEKVLATMRMANLMGNSLDYLLFRVSRGRWGN